MLHLLRRFLASRGLALAPIQLAPDLPSLLSSLPPHQIYFASRDPLALSLILQSFPSSLVSFLPDPHLEILPPPPPPSTLPFLLIADLSLLSPPHPSLLPYILPSSGILVHSKIADFLTTTSDLLHLANSLHPLGFHLHDRLATPLPASPTALLSSPTFFLFLPSTPPTSPNPAHPSSPTFRIAESLTHFSKPILTHPPSSLLTSRASLGFPAGIYNPGAIPSPTPPHSPILLARAERSPWPLQKLHPHLFTSSVQPLLLSLDENLQISRHHEVPFSSPPVSTPHRSEDFRLFSHEDRLYSNHSIIHLPANPSIPLNPASFPSSVSLALFEPEKPLLSPLPPLSLDRPTSPQEKNWAFFSANHQVHLLYSFQPYRLFSAKTFPSSHFTSTLDLPLLLPPPLNSLFLRNSINPVPYNSQSLFHLVHQVYPDKRYVFFPVLIDRFSLRPTHFSPRPLLSSPLSSSASILYASSVISHPLHLSLFVGIDDSSIASFSILKSSLDPHWIPIP